MLKHQIHEKIGQANYDLVIFWRIPLISHREKNPFVDEVADGIGIGDIGITRIMSKLQLE